MQLSLHTAHGFRRTPEPFVSDDLWRYRQVVCSSHHVTVKTVKKTGQDNLLRAGEPAPARQAAAYPNANALLYTLPGSHIE
jgi:hypothetical protein